MLQATWENEAQRVSRPKGMRRKIWLVPLAMLAAGVGYAYWLVWEGEEQYRKALALAKKDGLIATAEDLAGVRATSEENAAGFYQTAVGKLRSMTPDERSLISSYGRSKYSRESWFKSHGYYPTVKHSDAVCARYQDVIETLRIAASRPRYDYLEDYGRWSPGLSFRNLFQFVTSDAERCARKGDFNGAFERVSLLRGIARHLAQEPLSSNAISSSGAETAAATAALRVAWIFRRNPAGTATLRRLLSSPTVRPNLVQLQRTKLLQDLEGLQLVVSNPQALGLSHSDTWNVNVMFARLPQVQPRLKAAALTRARKDLQLLKGGTIEEVCLKLSSQDDAFDELQYRTSFLPGSSVGSSVRLLASAEVTRQLAIAMASVIDAWRENGKFPSELPGAYRLALGLEARKSLGVELESDHLTATVQNVFYANLQLPPDYEKLEKKGPRTRE